MDPVYFNAFQTVGVMAARIDMNDPSVGYALSVGNVSIEITPEEADRLGRFLLFDGSGETPAEEPSEEPAPE